MYAKPSGLRDPRVTPLPVPPQPPVTTQARTSVIAGPSAFAIHPCAGLDGDRR